MRGGASLRANKVSSFSDFTYSAAANNGAVSVFPPQRELASQVQDIVSRIGTTGGNQDKLGFAVGPLTFNHSDEEVRRLIKESFQIAREKNVAVCFHVDDGMFWDRNKALAGDARNIEWLDWKGTQCTGRRLEWSASPFKIGPQMCLNSPAVKAVVEQRAKLIGTEISREVRGLNAAGKGDLFAGVIAGWETMIGHDFATKRTVGYHALTNRGFGPKNTEAQCDAELVRTVKEFVELWAKSLSQAGIPSDKIYSHIAFTEQGLGTKTGGSFAQEVGFALPEVAFGKLYRPGFSTYPSEGVLEQIQNEVAKRGNPSWISAEGTNVVPDGMSGESTMETYLGKIFNHGGVMVTIFSWGIGGEAEKNNLFRRATENEEALLAYRKFLGGKQLIERPRTATFSPKRFQAKVHAIQNQVPAWVQKTRRPDLVQPLMTRLDGLIKDRQFEQADKVADEILRLTAD